MTQIESVGSGAPLIPPVLGGFHPVVRQWFSQRFPEGPSAPQVEGWPRIAAGENVLIAAPTGTGKTLAGFLAAINELFCKKAAVPYQMPLGISGVLGQREVNADVIPGSEGITGTSVIYVSPLKALAVDVHHNLLQPLEQIRDVALAMDLEVPPIACAVRTGDTTASQRAAMTKKPPDILVTTPESLYLLLTSAKSRENLRRVRTVIVDEVHALTRDKRGSHLALSLERLDAIQTDGPVQRVGLSATQRPIEATARLLCGQESGKARPVSIADCGHSRDLEISIGLPSEELSSVASTEQFNEVADQIAGLVADHRTTLVFVNTRRMSERLAHMLAERIGEDAVGAHHGSLSKGRRFYVESRLREGSLKALVATASLELGIDVGPVELVCQMGSPGSIAAFLQRLGRSNHSKHGKPKGVIFPLTRDELVECAALVRAIKTGDLDISFELPIALDVLAQQVIAEVAAEEWGEDELWEAFRQAGPYRDLSRSDFEEVLGIVSDGVATGFGRKGAYVHRDRVNGRLRARKGARLAALTSGGAIPETGDYRVILEPEGVQVGTVHEDFAIESMVGDVFLLGTHSWRVRKVESGVVRVSDAGNVQPTVPFWLGEGLARTRELSEAVSELRRLVAQWPETGERDLMEEVSKQYGLSERGAAQIVSYLKAGTTQLGVTPTTTSLVVERFFDESGGAQLVVHSPFGARLNRALGLSLRKRFCATFDFELQAAASDDAVLLSLGAHHSFPLDDVMKLVKGSTVPKVLSQAVLASPMFASRWRWNLNRSLTVLRFRGGKRSPIALQRMETDDVMAAVFPALAACQENMGAGPVEIPDHVWVKQTMDDCLHEAMDLDGLVELLDAVANGKVSVTCVDSYEPSVFAHEIVSARPYTFLDDAPLEERRSRAVPIPRSLPIEERNLASLDPATISTVASQVRAEIRDADELHDYLMRWIAFDSEDCWDTFTSSKSLAELRSFFENLESSGRAKQLESADGKRRFWAATETLGQAESLLYEDGDPSLELLAAQVWELMECSGPLAEDRLALFVGQPVYRLRSALALAESRGSMIRVPALSSTELTWASRRVLTRIHALSRQGAKSAVQTVGIEDFYAFLMDWQRVSSGGFVGDSIEVAAGPAGLLTVIAQLQGFEAAAGAWESSLFPQRVEGYRSEWLDELCRSGRVVWGRLSPPSSGQDSPRRGAATPSKSTPITFMLRDDFPWLVGAVRQGREPQPPDRGSGLDVYGALLSHGALFRSEIASITKRLPAEVDEGIWELVSRGLATCDGFGGARSMIAPRSRWDRRMNQQRKRGRASLRGLSNLASEEGRWSLLAFSALEMAGDDLAEAVAEQLLDRWGIVAWELAERESFSVPFRELLWALRRMEARGQVLGGRFVSGLSGEQYALPEAVSMLTERVAKTLNRPIRGNPVIATGRNVLISACDPLNLTGQILGTDRVAAFQTNFIRVADGKVLGEPGHKLDNQALNFYNKA